jgi:hypothetical protein
MSEIGRGRDIDVGEYKQAEIGQLETFVGITKSIAAVKY